MISIACDHPDVEEFIEVKNDLDKVTKANISIRVTNKFMEAVDKNLSFRLSFTREETGEVIEKTVPARDLIKKIAKSNFDTGEPGFLYWDRIENYNLLANTKDFKIECTNPCGELPLPAGGACLLGSINLSEFVTKNKTFNYNTFRDTVKVCVKALNEVLDEGMKLHPLQIQRDSARDWRQIGLGIFGLADMLIKMGITYGSEEAVALSDDIGIAMIRAAVTASAELAKKKGPFPKYNYDEISNTEFYKNNIAGSSADKMVKKYGLRNGQLLTIAPTGSLSTMLGVSGGIEPIFANYYIRKTESLGDGDQYHKVFTPIASAYMAENNLTEEEQLPEYFITAQTLHWQNRIDMQAIWQKHIDNSISSTVNLPEKATVDEIENIYNEGWKAGLKGITVFRDKCKRAGILSFDDGSDKKEDTKDSETDTEESSCDGNCENCTCHKDLEDKDTSNTMKHVNTVLNTVKNAELKRGEIIDVRDDTIGRKRKLMTGCGSLHCTAFFDPITGDLLETYFVKGSTGGCNNFMIGLSRMISLAARAGCSIEQIVDQLMSCGSCSSYTARKVTKKDTSKGACCPIAIGYALLDMHNDVMKSIKDVVHDTVELKMDIDVTEINKNKTSYTLSKIDSNLNTDNDDICPVCGAELIQSGGCNLCKECGWTRCD